VNSDIVAGVAVGSAERIRALTLREGCLFGGMLDPFASWLLLRGLRTLPLRMERHQENARRLAGYDPRLLRPRLVPRLVGQLLRLVPAGAS